MPPYPEKLINEGETVVLDLKPHWWFFWKHILAGGVLLIVVVLWALAAPDGLDFLSVPIALAIVVYVGFIVVAYLTWTYTHFVLTDRRVVSRSGIVSKKGTEIPLDRVNNIDFSQKIFERMIGAGDLAIESAGKDGQSHFENVRHPDMVQQEIYRQMEVNSRRQATWQADAIATANPGMQSARPPAAAPPDVADQIAKLATLRDQGAITSEEFETKKAELLDRM
ncbi:MAG: PH domain-containing protein [Acidimicrobiia bacterium]|nr:PH domain-containing protein [Acidimicrobiia bacterium]